MFQYIVAAPDQLQVLKGVIYPWCTNCSGVELKQLVGILGSVVMPHNIYFHSTLVLSRMLDRRSESAIFEANKYFAIESGGAMFFSFLFNLFVTSVSSKSFFNTPDAKNVTLFNAVNLNKIIKSGR
jgi:natural resistance-associated macrophage protein